MAAVELIRATPEYPWTAFALAKESFCSLRFLQVGFRKELGTTPMRYLANARMERAHADLASVGYADTTVSTVAIRWGFAHVGRFSVAYGRKYGELPSQTLRRAR